MRKLTAALVILTSIAASNFAFAQQTQSTEIQIFLNYRGANKYKLKVVSTTDNPVSAWYLYTNSPKPKQINAACYKGDPNEAIHLAQTMMQIFNEEYHRRIHVVGNVVVNRKTHKTGLQLFMINEYGHATQWFPHMRECVRWSTNDERWPTPDQDPPAGAPSPIPAPGDNGHTPGSDHS